ncbi:MAG: S-layer homology domain-containing protein [Oscillospiraceae bacterium]|nr:S-layer homology domain-containing protein [Oscillospiraceae bacterium]
MTKKLSRIVALMLAVIMSFSMLLVPVEAASFKDVSNKAWYKAAVDYVAERGWMSGVSSTTFAPNMKVTRGMAVTVLAKVAEADLSAYEPAFADTEAGKWYTKAAAWAADKGIVAGLGDGMFAPNRVITRQDLAVMLNSFIQFMEYELPAAEPKSFNVISDISGYAMDGAYVCSSIGLINGYDDGGFHPAAGATRAQLAQMIMRMDLTLNGDKVPVTPMPAQSFDETTADEAIQVQVEAPKGALPENSTMSTSRVTDEAALAAIQAKVDGQVFVAADITFSKDGQELEPDAAVSVELKLDGLENLENPAVYHINKDGIAEPVYGQEVVSLNRSGSSKALRFYAKDFSIYVVVDGGSTGEYARAKVNFYTAVDPANPVKVATFYVKNKDSLADLEGIVPDPGVGNIDMAGNNYTFRGWTIDDPNVSGDGADYTETTTPKNISQIRSYLKEQTLRHYLKVKFFSFFLEIL